MSQGKIARVKYLYDFKNIKLISFLLQATLEPYKQIHAFMEYGEYNLFLRVGDQKENKMVFTMNHLSI